MVATIETKHACFLRPAERRLPCSIKEICSVSRRAFRRCESSPAETEVIVRLLAESVPNAPIGIDYFARQMAEELLPARLAYLWTRIADEVSEAFKS